MKDYRIDGRERYKTMTLATDGLIRRFCCTSCLVASTASGIMGFSPTPSGRRTSALPATSSARWADRAASDVPIGNNDDNAGTHYIGASRGAPMTVIKTFERGHHPRAPPESSTQ